MMRVRGMRWWNSTVHERAGYYSSSRMVLGYAERVRLRLSGGIDSQEHPGRGGECYVAEHGGRQQRVHSAGRDKVLRDVFWTST
jgi:hypothetical protein